MNYKIVNNFLPEEIHSKMKETLIGGLYNFDWHLNNSVSKKNANDGCYFVHDFFPSWNRVSPEFVKFQPLIKAIKPKAVLRFRALLYPRNDSIEKHGWHRDYHKLIDGKYRKVRGFLLYINSNNGKTILKNDNGDNDIEIESIENRGLFFDAHEVHRSTSCSDMNYRCVIIINFIPKEYPSL